MDQVRLIVAIALSFAVFLIWQLFFTEEQTQQQTAKETQKPAVQTEETAKADPSGKSTEIGKREEIAPVAKKKGQTARIARTITVDAPLYRVQISENGAVFNSVVLKNFRETVDPESPPKELLSKDIRLETVRLAFVGDSIPGLSDAVFSADLKDQTLTVNDSVQQLTFSWESDRGVIVEKTYKFSPDSYLIGLEVNIQNETDQTIQDKMSLALRRMAPDDKRAYGFEGPSGLIGKDVERIKLKKIAENNTFSGNIQWIAIQDRYFLNSIIPQEGQDATMKLFVKPENIIESRLVKPESVIRPGTRLSADFQIFFGPKSMRVLNTIGHNLSKAVNFGMFDILAKPCVYIMNFIYGFIPNYGVAIILLTILVKIILWPLGSKSYKSMSAMKKLQPLMQEIRTKYKDDKKKMNEEVMGLYRTYKINPLGGCLPMIVQIPVFFALYRMLYEAIELRHAPFVLWIRDLSAPDRLFNFDVSGVPFMEPPYGIPVLTIIMGATMILQQKMSPPMGDPTQAKMMMLMPVVFTFIFINFSSGLVLYWLINNILSISQQYYIQKKFA